MDSKKVGKQFSKMKMKMGADGTPGSLISAMNAKKGHPVGSRLMDSGMATLRPLREGSKRETAIDRKLGLKEGSKKDMMQDKMMGVKPKKK